MIKNLLNKKNSSYFLNNIKDCKYYLIILTRNNFVNNIYNILFKYYYFMNFYL